MIVKVFFKDFFLFLTNPTPYLSQADSQNPETDSNPKLAYSQKLIYVFLGVVSSLVFAGVFGIFLSLIMFLIRADVNNNYRIIEFIENNTVFENFLAIAIIGPWIEEIAFRLFLTTKKTPFYLGLNAFSAFLILNYISNILIASIIFSGVLGFSTFVFFFNKNINKIFTAFFSKYSSLFLYSTNIIFALLHLSNYNNIFQFIILSPLLIFTQFAVGLMYSFIRVRVSFHFTFLAHALYNGVILGFYYLINLISFLNS